MFRKRLYDLVFCVYNTKDWKLSRLYQIFTLEHFKIFQLGIFGQQNILEKKWYIFALGMGPYFGPSLSRKGALCGHPIYISYFRHFIY